jgi:alpha/beta hydrolase fold
MIGRCRDIGAKGGARSRAFSFWARGRAFHARDPLPDHRPARRRRAVGSGSASRKAFAAIRSAVPKPSVNRSLWPVTDANFENASYHEFAEGHFLTRNMMKWFWDNYTPDPKQRQDVYASPLQATTERLEGLPPALIQTAEMDVLRDEGEAYGASWKQPGWMSPWSVTTA